MLPRTSSLKDTRRPSTEPPPPPPAPAATAAAAPLIATNHPHLPSSGGGGGGGGAAAAPAAATASPAPTNASLPDIPVTIAEDEDEDEDKDDISFTEKVKGGAGGGGGSTGCVADACAKLQACAAQGASRSHEDVFTCLVGLGDLLQRLRAHSTDATPSSSAAPPATTPIDTTTASASAVANTTLFGVSLRPHLSDPNPCVREATLRVFRLAMVDPTTVTDALAYATVDVFIVRALERDSVRTERTGSSSSSSSSSSMSMRPTSVQREGQNQYLGERIQGIKAARRMCKVAPLQVPRSIVFSLDAIAREKADPLRIVCLEALRELAIANPKLVAECFGMSTLFDAVLDPSLVDPSLRSSSASSSPSSSTAFSSSSSAARSIHHTPAFLKALRESILLSLLHIANSPRGRRYLHAGPMGGSIEFRRLLSPLVDPDYPSPAAQRGKPKKREAGNDTGAKRRALVNKLAGGDNGTTPLSDRELRWQASCDAVVLMMRTWQGVFLLTSDRQGGLRALFSMLVQPVPLKLRRIILHLIYQIVCIGAPTRLHADHCGLRDEFSLLKTSSVFSSFSASSSSSSVISPRALHGTPNHNTSSPRHGSNTSSNNNNNNKATVGKRKQFFRQASKNWNLVRNGFRLGGKMLHKTPPSSPRSSQMQGGNNKSIHNKKTRQYQPLKQFQEQYAARLRLKWASLDELVPGAWVPPPPSRAAGGDLGNCRSANNSRSGSHRSNTVGGHNALDNYAAIVVLALLHCGIVEPLIALGVGMDENNHVSPEDAARARAIRTHLARGEKHRNRGHGRQQRRNKAARDLQHGLGLSRPATRLLGVLIRMATRLLPQTVCRRTLADLQILVSAGTDRNSTTSSLRHGGVDEDKYALGGRSGNIKGGRGANKSKVGNKLASRSPIEQLCVEDYPARAAAMLNHLQRVTGFGCLFSRSGLWGGTAKAAQMLLPVDVLGENHTVAALSGRAGGIGGAIGFSHLRLARSLKSQTDNFKIDKLSLLELLRLTRVTTTKEPGDWDWDRITDILEGPISHNPAALTETLLHTKFLKRLGGFFRCDPGEKGYYGNLSWTPQNCQRFNRIASQMLRVLLSSGTSNNSTGGYYMGGKTFAFTRSASKAAASASAASAASAAAANSTSPGTESPEQKEKGVGGSSNRGGGKGGGVGGGGRYADIANKHSGNSSSVGMHFLRTDRRGKLVFEIVRHLMEILSWMAKGGSSNGPTHAQKQSQSNSRRGGSKSGSTSRFKQKQRVTTLKGLASLPSSATAAGSHLVFSRAGVLFSVCREYFMILGLLSSSTQGLQLLAEAGLFAPQVFMLAENNTHDYLARQIVNYLDCAHPGPARNLIQVWLTSRDTSNDLRLYCVNVVLHGLFRRGRIVDFAEWGISMLVRCLKTFDKRVALAALRILNEAASVREYLEALIALKPPLDELIKTSSSARMLMLRLLTVPAGFEFLRDSAGIDSASWLRRELRKWDMFADERNHEDTTQSRSSSSSSSASSPPSTSPSSLPVSSAAPVEGAQPGISEKMASFHPDAGHDDTTAHERAATTTATTSYEEDNYCCKYARMMERSLSRALFRDHEVLPLKPLPDAPWSYPLKKIPVLATANIGASARGEMWLSADSLGRFTNDGATNSSPYISGSGGAKPGAPVSAIGGGSDIDWLMRLPWHVIIMARDSMGWTEIMSDAHLSLVTDSDNPDHVRYVVRAKTLDELGAPCAFAISDPNTVLRCSLRLGDKYGVHANGYLSDLNPPSEDKEGASKANKKSPTMTRKKSMAGGDDGGDSSNDEISGVRHRGQTMEDFSTDQSTAMQTAMREVLGDAQNSSAPGSPTQESSENARKEVGRGQPEQTFWCSDTARQERMKYEHRTSSEGMASKPHPIEME